MVVHARQAQSVIHVRSTDDARSRSDDDQDNVHMIFRHDELVEKIGSHLEECVEGLHNQIAHLFVKHEASMKQLLASHDAPFVRADACKEDHQDLQALRNTASEDCADGISDTEELPDLDNKVSMHLGLPMDIRNPEAKRSEVSEVHWSEDTCEPMHGKTNSLKNRYLAQRANTVCAGWLPRDAPQSPRPEASAKIEDIFKSSKSKIEQQKQMADRSSLSQYVEGLGSLTPMMRYSQQDRELQVKLKQQAINRWKTVPIFDGEDACNCRNLCKVLVAKHWFDQLCAVILLSNAVWIGIQVEYLAANLSQDYPDWHVVVDVIYTLFFVAEIAIRVIAVGATEFFCGPHDRSWNIADFVIIVASTFELVFSQLSRDGGGGALSVLSGLRTVRVVRMARMARVIRLMRFFVSLRILIGAVLNTVKSCMWTGLLLCLIVYMFGIFFSQAVAEYRIKLLDSSPSESASREMTYYFGSLPRSMFTIFKAILGGIDWESAVQPLSDVDWTCVALFILMIIFVMLAVMNVVTGLFLQSALDQAQSDKEDIIMMQLKDKQEYTKKVQSVFGELDSNGDGQVSLDEFEEHLLDDRMQGFLQSLELDASDAWTLFKLLDVDGGGSVSMTEFVDGCFRMKGNAKSVQMAQMMYESKWMMDALMDLNEMCRKSFRVLLEELDSMRKKQGGNGKRLRRPKSPPGPQDVHPEMHVPGHPSAVPDLLQEWV